MDKRTNIKLSECCHVPVTGGKLTIEGIELGDFCGTCRAPCGYYFASLEKEEVLALFDYMKVKEARCSLEKSICERRHAKKWWQFWK